MAALAPRMRCWQSCSTSRCSDTCSTACMSPACGSRWPGMHSPIDSRASRVRALAARIVPVGVLLLAWELTARTGFVNPYVFPPVSEIVVRWAALVADATMLGPLWDTLWRALLGLGMAIVVGVPLGLAMGRIRA